MGSSSVSIFPWPECMHIQLLSRYQFKYNCEHILRYIHDDRCQCLQAAQQQIASCKSFSIWQFLNKDLPMAIITNGKFLKKSNDNYNMATVTGLLDPKTKPSWKWKKREESQKRADHAVMKVMKIWRHIHLCERVRAKTIKCNIMCLLSPVWKNRR